VIPLFTPRQVRAMDQRAFASGITMAALMERAAGHLARATQATAGRGYGLRVAILCGKGNNGGDGLAAARRLLDVGAQPTVVLVEGAGTARGLAAEQLRRWRAAGGRLADRAGDALAGADVAVDCLLGTGASGVPRPPYDAAITALNAFDGPVVACDLPSGVDADTGEVPAEAVRAEVTVTLGACKRGLALWPARGHVGRLILGDLGILTPDDQPVARILEAADAAALVPPPPDDSEKRSRGVVVALAGAPGMAGAAVMVARGAMVAGAGLVTAATGDPDVMTTAVPEALTAQVNPGDPEEAFRVIASHLEYADALAVGPGLGRAESTAALVHRLVREVDVPVVLDADGLNVFRHQGDALAEHAAPLLVLTPHVRELARLVGSNAAAGEPDPWSARATLVPEKARAWNAVIVAKGPGTMTAAPDGRVWVNPTGGAALASGGTGDVLTGMIATLVAQRPVAESVAAGVYLHGLAGEEAAKRRGPRSVSALDVSAAVPDALRVLDRTRQV
jgi:ADP-dependent NAD(P)H-hydrate dehydratase / NAD(P)H-hydrate epimerase